MLTDFYAPQITEEKALKDMICNYLKLESGPVASYDRTKPANIQAPEFPENDPTKPANTQNSENQEQPQKGKVYNWVQESGKWYCYDDSGRKYSGWQTINGVTYYFLSNYDYAMATGLWHLGATDKYYFFDDSGAMKTNHWYYDNSTDPLFGRGWRYFGEDGASVSGWQSIGGVWYFFDHDNNDLMTTGWKQINGKWYYMDQNGAMQIGWQKIKKLWYYFNSSGEMQTGWQNIDSSWYYFNTSGEMLTGSWIIGGKTYTFNKDGVWIP